MSTIQHQLWIRIASVFGFLGVATGAFGAHGLKSMVTPERLDVFQTGSRYCLVHAVVLLIVGIMAKQTNSQWINRAGWGFSSGVFIFSGSLWTLVLTDTGWLGAITPLGGVAMLFGWISLLLSTTQRDTGQDNE